MRRGGACVMRCPVADRLQHRIAAGSADARRPGPAWTTGPGRRTEANQPVQQQVQVLDELQRAAVGSK
ncbi:hypothetical protein GCM10027074_11170 [Streptomyces deserti]